MIILNFKNYPESTGQNAIKIVKEVEQLIQENSELIPYLYIAPAISDLSLIRNKFPNMNLVAQSVVSKFTPQSTGSVTPDILKDLNIKYSLFNHSENRVDKKSLGIDVVEIQKRGVKLIVCCEDIVEAKELLTLNPFGIAFEPQELIGGDYSVTNRSDDVKEFINATKNFTTSFIGAGIQDGGDIKKGLELGAEGFLIASSFVKADQRGLKIREFLKPFMELRNKFFQ